MVAITALEGLGFIYSSSTLNTQSTARKAVPLLGCSAHDASDHQDHQAWVTLFKQTIYKSWLHIWLTHPPWPRKKTVGTMWSSSELSEMFDHFKGGFSHWTMTFGGCDVTRSIQTYCKSSGKSSWIKRRWSINTYHVLHNTGMILCEMEVMKKILWLLPGRVPIQTSSLLLVCPLRRNELRLGELCKLLGGMVVYHISKSSSPVATGGAFYPFHPI